MIDLRTLRTAIAVSEHGSFRKAALAMGVAQSALSRQVRLLEDSIGVSIFQRNGGGVRLTRAGATFLQVIRKAIAEIDNASTVAGQAGRGELGCLRIGFYTSLSRGELRDLIVEYIRRFPGVIVQTIEAGAAKLAAGLDSNAIDIAVTTNASTWEWSGDALELWTERILVALPKKHELSKRAKIYWHELVGQRCLLTRREPGVELLDYMGRKTGSADIETTIIHHNISLDSLLGLVAAGAGVTVLYESGATAAQGEIVFRELIDELGPSSVSYAAVWKPCNDNPALRRLLSLIRERYMSRPSIVMASEY